MGLRISAIACALLLLPGAAAPPAPARYDLVISGGMVLDGSGGPMRRADIGVRGDRIVAVGDLSNAAAGRRIDARDRYVTPGFVSVHDHSEAGQMATPIGLLSQGITTAIGNPDGFGPTDILAPLRGIRPGINYGGYIGFNAVWGAVMGAEDLRPTRAQIGRMRDLVEAGLAAGAYGVSAGLDYKPGFFATTDEVVEVVSAGRSWRTDFPNHDRIFAGNGFSSLAGQDETIRIGARAGLMPVITHMHMLSRDQGRADAAFRRIASWRARGVQVGIDAYPYTYAATALEQILIPAWAQAGGKAAMMQRFAEPEQRARIVAETDATIADRIRGAANLRLPDLGRELTEIVAEWNVSPGEAVVRLLEQGQENVIIRSVTEADRTRILADPNTAISCDCGAIASTTGHPRNWGAYPRFFGHYVREQRIATWPEAVRRATALPAAMIGMVERGWLRPGMIADVTILNPRTIIDRATIAAPTARSEGIVAVIVNGQVAWQGGTFYGGAGQALRRARYEPSRPFDPSATRTLAGDLALAGGGRLAVDVRMTRSDPTPVGRAVLSGGRIGSFRFTQPGLLQTAPGWAALTGMGRDAQGRARAATLIVDSGDPAAPRRTRILLLLEGQAVLDTSVRRGVPRIRTRFSPAR